MLFWIFLVRCSSRSTVIFLIVRVKKSKSTIRENFTFFQKRNIVKFGIHVHHWKKNRKKNLQFFFRTPKLQNKKIRNKQNVE